MANPGREAAPTGPPSKPTEPPVMRCTATNNPVIHPRTMNAATLRMTPAKPYKEQAKDPRPHASGCKAAELTWPVTNSPQPAQNRLVTLFVR
jgi:hypothetical protein